MTIFDHSGHWSYNNAVGITIRHMHDPTDCTYPWVASICRHPKLIKYYTDEHDVDEDLRTIASCNGNWPNENLAGVTFRHMNDIHINTYNFVASVQKKINRTYSPFGDACSISECSRLHYLLEDNAPVRISIVMKYPSAWQTDTAFDRTILH